MRPLLFFLSLLLVFPVSGQEFLKTKIKNEKGTAIKYSNNDEFLAINSRKDLILYNAGSGVKIRTFAGFRKGITSIDFNLESDQIMASSLDNTVKIWEVVSGKLLTEIIYTQPVRKVKYIDQLRIAFITDNEVVVWNTVENRKVWSKVFGKKPLRALSVNQSKGTLAAGGGDHVVHLISLSDGSPISEFKYHQNWIRNLSFHPTLDLLASSSDDGSVLIWDIQKEQFNKVDDLQSRRVYGLKFSNDGSILAYGADGLYFYSVEKKYKTFEIKDFNANIIGMDISASGKEVATIEDFIPNYKIWDVTTLNIAPVYLARDKTDRTPPQLYISYPSNIRNDRVRVSADLINIKGTVIDESGVRNLKVNNLAVPVRDNGGFVINLPLTPGENYVTVEASDINDNIMLRKFIIDRQDQEGDEYDRTLAKNYLFVVGINDYQNWPKLNNAVNDASDITKVLMSNYQFDFDNVILIKDEQATRTNIYNSLRSLIEKVTPKDNLMIYFSGHGFYDDLLNEGYWIPVEAETNSIGDYLPNTSILKILENIDTQHTFLVADACFSGSLFSNSTRGYVENVEKYKSRWGLASGRLEVVSDGAVGENSPFASVFIEFLETNTSESFPVSELVQYVKIKTAETSDQTPLGNPLKSLGDEGGEFIFYKKGN